MSSSISPPSVSAVMTQGARKSSSGSFSPLGRIPSIGSTDSLASLESLSVTSRDVEPRLVTPRESVQEDSRELHDAKLASAGLWATSDDGVQLYYELHGARGGGSRVLFIAGLNATFEAWSLQSAALTRRHGVAHECGGVQLVVFDNRGVGFSDAPAFTDSAYSTERMARDALTVADAVGWSTFVIVAHSLGGMIAQRVALLAPTRVRGLLLAATRISGGFWHSLPTWTGLYQFVRMRMASTADEELEQTLHFLFPADWLSMHCKQTGSDVFSYKTNRDWVFDMMRRRKGAKTAAGSEGQLSAARAHALAPHEIAALRAAHASGATHIIVVTGTEDLVVPPYHARQTADALCGGALVEFEQCGHALAIQESERFNQLIVELCERVRSGESQTGPGSS